MRTLRIIETCLYVGDLNAARKFYERVLGLEAIDHEDGRHLFFRCDAGVLLLFNPKETAKPGGDVPEHGAEGPGHAAFAMNSGEVDAWREHLENEKVEIEREVKWPSGDCSIYFRDPAGNSLELVTPTLWDLKE